MFTLRNTAKKHVILGRMLGMQYLVLLSDPFPLHIVHPIILFYILQQHLSEIRHIF